MPIEQALEWISQHRTGMVILIVVMVVTMAARNRK
jgi:hypothetical protein